MAGGSKERSLEVTPTWAVAVVCFILVVISIIIEHLIHLIGAWLKKKHKRALCEALEKIKAELMLLGFISLILTVVQDQIAKICIPRSVGYSWHPCARKSDAKDDYDDPCESKGKVQFVSAYGLHQLHIFIFVLAVAHILYCIVTLGLGTLKMRKWKIWENETKTVEYQYYNDPERFRFARETSFGRRHLSFWSSSPVLLWIMCFFRQFITSVAKVDYMTLRHGFVIAHLAPQSQTRFDFQKYISGSLEEDFKVVVGISPIVWFFAVLFLLTNTHDWKSYFWLPFTPLIIILLVGTKLQVVITKMGLRIQDKGGVVKGTPVVKPGDDLFWFNRPRLLLYLIHFVLFQNAFQLAFFFWSWYEFGWRTCFHQKLEDIIIRLSMGFTIQFLCSYVTLPLYALVTQMGSTMRPTIFSDQVRMALRNWHHTAKRHTKHGQHSLNGTPYSSRPGTPPHGTSPLHLLRNYQNSTSDCVPSSPPWPSHYEPEASRVTEAYPSTRNEHDDVVDVMKSEIDDERQQEHQTHQSAHQREDRSEPRAEHEIKIGLSDFSFNDKR